MRIIADKAVSVWLSHDDRNSEKWNDVKQMIMGTTVEELDTLSSCFIQSLEEHLAGSKDTSTTPMLSNCQVLLVAGSSDGTMQEEMPSLILTDDKHTTFQLITVSPRLFWWGAKGKPFADDLIKWIFAQ
jgi:hypothetical protein